MESFSAFDAMVTSADEQAITKAQREKQLKEAIFAVQKKFGNFLKNARTAGEYDERFSYLGQQITEIISEKVNPTKAVLAWVKESLTPKFSTEMYDPHEDWDDEPENKPEHKKHEPGENLGSNKSSSKTASTKLGWQYDPESRSFKSHNSSFSCLCGCSFQGVGQHTCSCGSCDKIWNISSITDGNKTASTPLYVAREVMRRNTILGKTKIADIDPNNPVPGVTVDQNDVVSPASNTDPMAANMTDPVQQSRVGTKRRADVVDPTKAPKTNKEFAPGYDVNKLLSPAVGEDHQDEGWEERMKSQEKNLHDAALKAIFADDETEREDVETPPQDDYFDNSASDSQVTPMEADTAPMPMAPPMPPSDPVNSAQDAILDLILQEKENDVVSGSDSGPTQDLLEDAYNTLNTVKVLQDATNPVGEAPIPAGPPAASTGPGFAEGYLAGFFDAITADNTYEDRKTDYVGTEPPIPGVSNGLDDAVPGRPADVTKEFRNEFAKELDDDNGATRDEKPLDPGDMFGPDKGKSAAVQAKAEEEFDSILFMR